MASLNFAETQLALRLVALVLDWNETDDVPREQQHEARAIGEKLNEIGGYKSMLAVYDYVHARYPSACVLQAYWDNIGTWRW